MTRQAAGRIVARMGSGHMSRPATDDRKENLAKSVDREESAQATSPGGKRVWGLQVMSVGSR